MVERLEQQLRAPPVARPLAIEAASSPLRFWHGVGRADAIL